MFDHTKVVSQPYDTIGYKIFRRHELIKPILNEKKTDML